MTNTASPRTLSTARRFGGGGFRIAEEPESPGAGDLASELELGRIVYFPECPIALPPPADLDFLREEMPKQLRLKNVSYHPESDRIHGMKGHDAMARRAHDLLKAHTQRVQAFLAQTIPAHARDWKVGTSSFRPLQEKGRNLSAHASNELVHVDAGAYGATHGDRILRFFVNVNPTEDRVWITKGAFPQLYQRFGGEAGIRATSLQETMLDRAWTGTVKAASLLAPAARVIDSSPYDRAMRRFHNFMKDTPSFQANEEGHQEVRFAPFSAWMVLTDMVSHACIEGQFAFVDTFIVPLANCGVPAMAPINILRAG